MSTYYVSNAAATPAGAPGNDGTLEANPKQFAAGNALTTWLNALAHDDIVIFAPSPQDYFETGTALQTLTKNLFLWAKSYGADDMSEDWMGDGLPIASRFQRTVRFDGFFKHDANIGMDGICNRLKLWPAAWEHTNPNANRWIDMGLPQDKLVLVANGRTLTRTRCEIFIGYGPEGWAPFEIGRMYDEMRTPDPWYFNGGNLIGRTDNGTRPDAFKGWGNLPGDMTQNYNACAYMPDGFGCETQGASLITSDEWLHDLGYGVAWFSGSGGRIVRQVRPFAERFMHDFQQVGVGAADLAEWRTHGFIMRDFVGHKNDGGNPHNDFSQSFTLSGLTTKRRRYLFSNGIYYARNAATYAAPAASPQRARSGAQFGWHPLQLTSSSTTAAIKLSRVVSLGCQKLLRFGKGKNSLIDKCIGVMPDDITAVENEGTTDVDGIVMTGTKAMVRDTILETIPATGEMVQQNTARAGSRTSRVIPLADLFENPTAPRSTPASAFDAFKPKAAHATKGHGFATLRALLEAPLAIADEPLFFGIGTQNGLALNTLIASEPIYVHGSDDQPISVSAGEWRVLDVDEATQIQAYQATPGTAPAGKFIHLRRATANAFSTSVTTTVTVGGVEHPWVMRTLSPNDLPGIAKPDTIDLVQTTQRWQRNGLNLGDTKHGMMWLDMMVPNGLANAAYDFLLSSSTRPIRIIVSTLTSSWQLQMTFRNAANSTIASVSFWDLPYNTRVRAGMSVDTSLLTLDERHIAEAVRGDTGALITPSAKSCTQDGTIGFTWAGAAGLPQFLNAIPVTFFGFYAEFERSLQMLGLTPKPGWDWRADDLGPAGEGIMANPAHSWRGDHAMDRAYAEDDGVVFNALSYVSLAGGNIGNAPSGTEADTASWRHVRRRPVVFMPGLESAIEAGAANLGTGSQWPVAGTGDITAANAMPWPPVLDEAVQVLTPGPYHVGRPIDFLVTATGFTRKHDVTPASDKSGAWAVTPAQMPLGSNGIVVTFTPSATGDHSFTFANNAGYTAPAATLIAVEDAPVELIKTIPIRLRPGEGRPGAPFDTAISIYEAA